MAILAFDRLRMLWGAFDWQHGTNNPYSVAQTTSGGASAAGGVGSIGVRRSVLVFDRSAFTPGQDDVEIHFDWLNYTGGSPDDTWTVGDYTTMENHLITWHASIKNKLPVNTKWREVRWYRAGPGVVAPNPAERVLTHAPAVAGTGGVLQPFQCAVSLTFRTAVRKSWGRTYFPGEGVAVDANCFWPSATADAFANVTKTLIDSAAASDFQLVVVSHTLSAALAVEKIEVDNVPDVIRRRRQDRSTYRKILP